MRGIDLNDRKRIAALVAVMIFVSIGVAVVTGWGLYRAAVQEQRAWLLKIVQSHAALIEATVHVDAREHGETSVQTMLDHVIVAQMESQGFGWTGEFVIGRRSGDQIDFLLPQRRGIGVPRPVPLESHLAEPMRLALAGRSGTIIDLDYRDVVVLAAYTPIRNLNVGLVAKIDLEEIRRPYIRAGILSGILILVLLAFGATLSRRITAPMIGQLETAVVRLEEAQRLANLGNWHWDIASGRLDWSAEIYRIFGVQPDSFDATYENFLRAVHPDDQEAVDRAVKRSLDQGEPYGLDHRIVRPDGSKRTVHEEGEVIRNDEGNPAGMLGTVQDITERKQIETKLAVLMDELLASNRDLEQFAYAASHDLQEPLRAVAGYAQLLERKYQGQLDDKADHYLVGIVDGAHRMQRLIESLLMFSRVTTKGKDAVSINSAEALEKAVKNMTTAMRTNGAEVDHGPLPTVMADEEQLVMVFQNLISNSIKFRGDDPPRIRVEAFRQGGDWQFSVSDNGVGMDTQYADRIFEIFQRLYTQADYPGEGMGLAVCKKIIERHGGKIWVESAPGEGATFLFTIPA